jgi:hypothetical protein
MTQDLAARLEALADEPSEITVAPAVFRCARCGSEGELPGPVGEVVFRCEDCGTCYAFGVELARVTNQPLAEDRRFVSVRFEHAGAGADCEFRLEREYARGVALDLLSVVDPAVFEAFRTLAAALLGDRNSSSGPGEAVATLDEPGS